MNQTDAEAALHAHVRAIMAGNFAAAFRSMTPEGMASAMQVGNASWKVTSYDFSLEGRSGDELVFSMTFQTDLGPLPMRYRLCDVDGAWKVTRIERAT